MRKKKTAEHVNHERWLVSYADFITLLFAFFVVMYAIAMKDQKKAKDIAEAVRQALAQAGITSSATGGAASAPAQSGPSTILDKDVQKIAEVLRQELGGQISAGGNDPDPMQFQYQSSGLTMRLSANHFYAEGAAEMKSEALMALDRIAAALKNGTQQIRVEGHTDNQPVQSELYPTNWELSAARAAWVVRYLAAKHHIDPKRLSAAGYAEYRPLADNDSPRGRNANRRIEITVLGRE
jgi:chemotaxis protein MotB